MRMSATYGLLVSSAVLLLAEGYAQSGAWTRKRDFPPAHCGAAASVVNGRIYVLGGLFPNLADAGENYMYDPTTDTWETKTPLPTPRSYPSSAVVNGIIYCIGGGYPESKSVVEAYDPLTDSWTRKRDMLNPRLGARAAVVDGIIYNIGGNYSECNCEAYDPATDTWTRKADRPDGGCLSAAVYKGIIYTFGGSTIPYGWVASASVYAYDPKTDTWTKKADMPTARFSLHTFLIDRKIYAIGGSRADWSALATVEVYDPVNDSWESESNMPRQLVWFAAEVVNDKVYIIAGTADWFFGSTEVWEYNPLFTSGLLVVTPTRYDFLNVRCGSSSDTLEITIRNRDSTARYAYSLSLGTGEFRLTEMPTLPLVLPPDSEARFDVVFTPAFPGVVVWDTLVLETEDTLWPRKAVPLRGRGSGEVRSARAGVLYGISSSSGRVGSYEIEQGSGYAALTATVSPRPPPGLSAFTVRGSDTTLYGAFSSADETELFRLSSEHGDLERFGKIPLGGVASMVFSPDGRLFLVTSSGRLYNSDPGTLDTVFIGSTGYPFTGLAFSPATGVLWASLHDTIFTVDTASGSATMVGCSGWDAPRSSIAFNGLGVMYGLYGIWLVTIGKVWGDASEIGATGVPGLVAIAMRGDVVTGVDGGRSETPLTWRLDQNFPNPFNPSTVIRYAIAGGGGSGAALVRLSVYDILGREVAVLVNEKKASGIYDIAFDSGGLSSGVYFCRLVGGTCAETRRMMLIR